MFSSLPSINTYNPPQAKYNDAPIKIMVKKDLGILTFTHRTSKPSALGSIGKIG
jgi:hypothetical protein